jgi:hypothetical protein
MTYAEYTDARIRLLEEQTIHLQDQTRRLERHVRVCIGFIFVLMPLAAFGIAVAATTSVS